MLKYSQAGDQLELQVAAVFQARGFLARRAIPLLLDQTAKLEATDLDVVGFKFVKPFQLVVSFCDCKDKARAKPFERIFWAKGAAHYMGANQVFVALKKANPDLRAFAARGQVQILTFDMLQETFQKAFGHDGHGHGQANHKFFPEFARVNYPIYKNMKDAKETATRAQSLYFSEDPFPALNEVYNLLQASTGKISEAEGASRQVWRMIVAELIVVYSFLVLRIASLCVGMPRREREEFCILKLTFGRQSPEDTMRWLRLSVELAKKLAGPQSLLTDKQASELASREIPPPPYSEDFLGLLRLALDNPQDYLLLPQLLDFLLFEQALQTRKFSVSDCQERFDDFSPALLKAARNILYHLKGAAGLAPKDFWDSGELPSGHNTGKAGASSSQLMLPDLEGRGSGHETQEVARTNLPRQVSLGMPGEQGELT